MGWKPGHGLGRSGSGITLPIEASIKTDMGGLRVEGEEGVAMGGGWSMREMTDEMLSDAAVAHGLPTPAGPAGYAHDEL